MGMPAQFSNAGAPLEASLPTYLLRRALVRAALRAAAERRVQPFVRTALCAAADRCDAVRREAARRACLGGQAGQAGECPPLLSLGIRLLVQLFACFACS